MMIQPRPRYAYRNIYGVWLGEGRHLAEKTTAAEELEATGWVIMGSRACPTEEESARLDAACDRHRSALVNGILNVQLREREIDADTAFDAGVEAAQNRRD